VNIGTHKHAVILFLWMARVIEIAQSYLKECIIQINQLLLGYVAFLHNCRYNGYNND